MNPFDYTGPQFLGFYLGLGIAVNLILRNLMLRSEGSSPAASRVCSDPYKLAYLRDGGNETLRVVLFSLIDRCVLKACGDEVAAEPQARETVTRPIELATVEFLSTPRQVRKVFTSPSILKAVAAYGEELAREGLLTDESVLRRRRKGAALAFTLLVGVSVVKIGLALSRGHHNVWFLVILTVVFSGWVFNTWHRKRTGAGDEVLRRARVRYKGLKEQAQNFRPGAMTNDAMYVAALFGLGSLPGEYFPYLPTFFPQSTSSSAGSSGGCGGSSGCGGGGCGGGGCGGCGGGD